LAAERDLEHIRATILAENRRATDRARVAILRAFALLQDFPRLGRQGSVAGTREKAVRGLPYLIVYTIDTDAAAELVILRVFHGAQSRP
jgi:plasmid stabilization system protein ParE